METVYKTKPTTSKKLWQETEWPWADAIAADLVTTCQSMADSCKLCHEVKNRVYFISDVHNSFDY
jgi:hypothetical protein